jgi:hypothetical protein
VSIGDKKRGSWTAEARASTRCPPATRAAHESWSLPELDLEKPAKNPLECIRHDAGSAVHSLHGFVDLLSMGACGPMTEAQLRSIHHLKGAAQRLFELIESSLELTQPGLMLASSELRVASFAGLVRGIVHSSARERSGVTIELDCPLPEEQADAPVAVDPESFTRALNLVFDALVENGHARFAVRVRERRGHAVVDVSLEREEHSVTQSIPMQRIALAEVDQVSVGLSNRCYLQLKRCEALLKRQGGSLQLAPDLARVRVALPLAQER